MPLSKWGGRVWVNPLRSSTTQSSQLSRRIGRFTHIHEFCKKYDLSRHTVNDNEDIMVVIINALETLIIQNEFRRNHDKESYKKLNVMVNDEKVLVGYFTDEQIEDINKLDYRLSLEV